MHLTFSKRSLVTRRFELHSNSRGADEIKGLPISIDFCNRNTELLLQFSIISPWLHWIFQSLRVAKMKKLDRGFTWKTSVRFIFCLHETMNRNQNNWICDISIRGFLIEILLHIQRPADKVMSGFLFTFITHKLWEHLVWGFTVS